MGDVTTEVQPAMSVPVSRPRLTALAFAAVVALSGCDRRSEPAACTPEPAPVAAVAPAPAATTAAAAATTGAPPAASPPPVTGAARPADRPAAPAASPRAATDLRIRRLVVAEGVEGREPVAPRRTFARGELERVYAFVEVENPERLPGDVVVSFEPADGPAIGNVPLTVGAAPRWRTWAFSRAVDRAGEWAAVVRDGEGRVLAREPFTVTL